jgi:hypothetical protein
MSKMFAERASLVKFVGTLRSPPTLAAHGQGAVVWAKVEPASNDEWTRWR